MSTSYFCSPTVASHAAVGWADEARPSRHWRKFSGRVGRLRHGGRGKECGDEGPEHVGWMAMKRLSDSV
jgi:hypothetical protein